MILEFENTIPAELASDDKYVREFRNTIIDIIIKQFTNKIYKEYDELVNENKHDNGELEIKINLNISNTNK